MIFVNVPIKLISEANASAHWATKHKRKKRIQYAVFYHLNPFLDKIELPCQIILERVGQKKLDDDNLIYCFKYVRDMIAKMIIEHHSHETKPLGYHDSDQRLSWAYTQKIGKNSFNITIRGTNEETRL